jgi:hypothetical protein
MLDIKKIYLAGSIPKGNLEEKTSINWRDGYIRILKDIFDCVFIIPGSEPVNENDFLLIFGTDCSHIQKSDLVILNAEERLGAGSSMEMVIAKYFKKPVITVIPKNSYHRKQGITFQGKYFVEDWIHPFIHTFSDFIVENVSEIGEIKSRVLSSPTKDISIIDEAIKYQKNNLNT